MNKLIAYLSKYLLGNGSHHSGNYTILRNVMAAAYLIVIAWCTWRDPNTRNTVIMSTAGIVTALCGTHTISSYFGRSVADTNPGAPD